MSKSKQLLNQEQTPGLGLGFLLVSAGAAGLFQVVYQHFDDARGVGGGVWVAAGIEH